MRSIVALAMLLALCSAGSAGVYTDSDGGRWELLDPPKKYEGITYNGTMSVKLIPRWRVKAICKALTNKADPHGCASAYTPTSCEIFVSDDLPPLFRNAVQLHEEAHCKGWTHD